MSDYAPMGVAEWLAGITHQTELFQELVVREELHNIVGNLEHFTLFDDILARGTSDIIGCRVKPFTTHPESSWPQLLDPGQVIGH